MTANALRRNLESGEGKDPTLTVWPLFKTLTSAVLEELKVVSCASKVTQLGDCVPRFKSWFRVPFQRGCKAFRSMMEHWGGGNARLMLALQGCPSVYSRCLEVASVKFQDVICTLQVGTDQV